MKLYDIVFSPTGGTQKVAALLTEALGGEVTHVDLTDSKLAFHTIQLTPVSYTHLDVYKRQPQYGLSSRKNLDSCPTETVQRRCV